MLHFRNWLIVAEGIGSDVLQRAIALARGNPTPSLKQIAQQVGMTPSLLGPKLKPLLTVDEYEDVMYASRRGALVDRLKPGQQMHAGQPPTRAEYEAKRREVVAMAAQGDPPGMAELESATGIPRTQIDGWLKAGLDPDRYAAVIGRTKEMLGVVRKRHSDLHRVLTPEQEAEIATLAGRTPRSKAALSREFGVSNWLVSRLTNHRMPSGPFWDELRAMSPHDRLGFIRVAASKCRHDSDAQEDWVRAVSDRASQLGIEVPE